VRRQPQQKMNAYIDTRTLKRVDAIARKVRLTRTELLRRMIAEQFGQIERLVGIERPAD
jgi:Ribbon-helix-helix protein, copG family